MIHAARIGTHARLQSLWSEMGSRLRRAWRRSTELHVAGTRELPRDVSAPFAARAVRGVAPEAARRHAAPAIPGDQVQPLSGSARRRGALPALRHAVRAVLRMRSAPRVQAGQTAPMIADALLAAATTLAVLLACLAALYLFAPVEWPGAGEGARVVDGGAP